MYILCTDGKWLHDVELETGRVYFMEHVGDGETVIHDGSGIELSVRDARLHANGAEIRRIPPSPCWKEDNG